MPDIDFLCKLLGSIEDEIAERISPDLSTADARTHADIVYLLLGWLKRQLRDLDGLAATRDAALRAKFAEASLDIGALLPRLARRLAASDAGTADLARFHDALDIEKRFSMAQDPEPPADLSSSFLGGRRAQAGTRGNEPVRVTEDTLIAYLRSRHPAASAARVSRLQRLPGGMGKETILFTIDGLPGFDGDAVLRMDLPVLSTDNSVVNEYPLLVGAWRKGIPVPEPLWCESDRSIFGGAFIVVRRVPGSTDVSGWIGDPAACARFGLELAKTMARLHRLGPDDFERSEPATTAIEATLEYIESTRRFYRSRAVEPNPRIEAGFEFLLARPPADDGRPPALVHGDIGFHNLMMDAGGVTAVLDWDYTHFGDPAEDVSYCRPFVERILAWRDFLASYHAHGGRPYTDEQDHYYAVWRDVRNAAACVGALGAYRLTERGNIKLAAAGVLYGPRFEIAALDSMAKRDI